MLLASVLTSAPTAATSTPAATGPFGAPAGGPLGGMVPLILIFAVFYLLLIRPQQKKYKDLQAHVKGLKKGDEIVTGGGMYGRVTKADSDEFLMVEIAPGIEVKVSRGTVASVVSPVVAPSAAEGKAAKKARKADESRTVANDN